MSFLGPDLFPSLSGGDHGGNRRYHRHEQQQEITEPFPKYAPSDLRDELDAAHDSVTKFNQIIIRRLVEPPQVVRCIEF